MKNQDERGRTLYTLELLAVLVLLAVMLVDSLKQGNVGMSIFLAAGVLAVLSLIYVEFILPRLPEKKSKANKRPSAARKQSKPEKAQPQKAAAVHTTGKNVKGKFKVSCYEAAKEKDGKTLHRLFHVTEYDSEDGMVGEEINVWYSNDTGKPAYYLEQRMFDGGNMWGNRHLGIKAITGEEMRTLAERYSVPVPEIAPVSKKAEEAAAKPEMAEAEKPTVLQAAATKQAPVLNQQSKPEKKEAQPQKAAAVHTTGKNVKGKFEVSCHEAVKEKDGKTLHRLFHETEYHSEDGMVGEEIKVWYSNDTGKPVYYLEQSIFDGGNMWGNRALEIKEITGEEMRTMAERYSVPVPAITPASKKEEIKEPDAAVVNAFREKILQYCDDKVKDFQRIAAMSAFEKGKHYTLHSVVFEEARACVPGGPGKGWDGVNYRLDLENHALSVHCFSDPALYGSPPEWTFSITPEKFHETAKANGFPAELLTFRTQSDWDWLFDTKLIKAVTRMREAATKQAPVLNQQSKPEKKEAQPQPDGQTAADKAKEAQEGTTASTRGNSRPEIKDIGQAAAYSTIETNMRPGGLSEFSKDCKYQITLFRTNRGPTGWGIDEEVVVDSRDHTPYWIVTQYDGQIAASIWYLEKKKLTFDEVRAYARDVSEEVYNQVCGINAENYKQIAEALKAAEAARRAEKARKAKEARQAEEARKAEEARQANEARQIGKAPKAMKHAANTQVDKRSVARSDPRKDSSIWHVNSPIWAGHANECPQTASEICDFPWFAEDYYNVHTIQLLKLGYPWDSPSPYGKYHILYTILEEGKRRRQTVYHSHIQAVSPEICVSAPKNTPADVIEQTVIAALLNNAKSTISQERWQNACKELQILCLESQEVPVSPTESERSERWLFNSLSLRWQDICFFVRLTIRQGIYKIAFVSDAVKIPNSQKIPMETLAQMVEAVARPEMAKPLPTKVDILRERIIANLEDFPRTEYLLDTLYGEEVPPDLYTPDFPFAHFNLNVRTRKLSVMMDNYPDKDGRPGPSCYRPLTPEEFHNYAVQSELAPELVDFRTQADWDVLYDDALLEAIKVNDRLTARQKEEIRRSGAMIPDECFQSQPKMNIASITFGIETISQRISILFVQLTQENGKYRISYLTVPNIAPRVLSDAEAVYAENELERLRNLPIHDPDHSEVDRLRREKNEAHFVKLTGSLTDGTEIRQTVESECTMLRLCYGSWRESEKLPDAAAVNALREKLLQYCDNMVKQYLGDGPTLSYENTKRYLLYDWEREDPTVRGGGWASDFYRLDLETHALSAECNKYPDQYRVSNYAAFSVMPEKFHETAEANGFPAELLAFKTQSDWDWLFDAKLIKAVNRMKKAAEQATRDGWQQKTVAYVSRQPQGK